MKKSLYISAIAFLMAGTALTSCSDYLEADDKTNGNKDADTYLNANPSALLMAAYNSTYNFASEVEMTDEGTDLYMPHRGKTASAFDQYTFNASTAQVQNYYVKLYGTINYANGVIEKTMSETESAEARFLRAWCYYLLTQHYGSVPYSTSYIQSSNRNYPRTSLDSIYACSIEDLKTCKTYLSDKASRANIAQPSKQACDALIAKFYLAWGWDKQVDKGDPKTAAGQEMIKKGEYAVGSNIEYFKLAAQYADAAVNGINLSSLSFENKWSPKNENNAENFWAIQYDRASYTGSESDGGHSLQSAYGNYYGECTATGLKQSGSIHGQTLKSAYLYEEGDARYAATYMTTMYNKIEATPTDNGMKQGGYYLYYNNPSATSKICYMYFPYYTTTTEAEKFFKENKERFTYDASVNNQPKAYIIGSTCTEYNFASDGSYTKKTLPFNDLAGEVAGGVTVKKYDDIDTKVAASNDYRDIVIFHASDSYLDAAEAYLMAGDQATALARLNAVRERSITGSNATLSSFSSYSPAYSTTLNIKPIDVILDERARELYAERNRWIDLRRTNQLIRYNLEFNPNFIESNAKNSAGEWKTYRPIPATELGNNTGMDATKDQNPGY